MLRLHRRAETEGLIGTCRVVISGVRKTSENLPTASRLSEDDASYFARCAKEAMALADDSPNPAVAAAHAALATHYIELACLLKSPKTRV